MSPPLGGTAPADSLGLNLGNYPAAGFGVAEVDDHLIEVDVIENFEARSFESSGELLRVLAAARDQIAYPCASKGAKGRPDLERTLDGLDALADLGVTQAAFALPRFVHRAGDIREFLETLGKRAR